MMPISSEVGITSNRLPCSGLIFTISCTSRSSNPASMNLVSGPVMKNVPGPSMWMLVAVAAANARSHNCTNSAHRASPARAFSNTSSGSKSRKRMRIDRRPIIRARCPLPPQPQKLSFGSSVTTVWPPSHTPSLAGYRPNPTPFPSVHTRVSWFSFPCVAAMPAAMASASLKTRTGTPAALPFSEEESAPSSAKPFTCCRLGDSSTTPFWLIPVNPMPTAAIFSAPATFSTSPRMQSAMSAEGIDCKGSSDCAVSGKVLSGPTTLLPSTRPAAICSITSTPTVLPIVLPPIFFNQKSLSPSPYCQNSPTFSFLCLSARRQFGAPLEPRGLVALRQRRIIENRVHKIFHCAFQREHRLPDVQQFRSAFADDVHAEQFLGRGIEQQLQSSRGVAANLAARNFAEIRHADFVRNAFVRELLFGFSDEGNLGNGVNPIRVIRAVGMDGHAEGFRGGDAPLFH